MLTMFVSILPILIATIFMLCKKDSTKSLFIGLCVGVILFLFSNGFNVKNFISIYNVVCNTMFENISVLLSIFLLLFIVFFIKNSNVIVVLNRLTERYIDSQFKLIIFLMIFGIVFSLDDYLLCISTSVILNDIAQKHGFSKEKNTFLINLTAVCCCCLSPFSSWMPVIKNTLMISGLHETDVFYTVPYNFTALYGLILVIIVGIFKPTAFNSLPDRLENKVEIRHSQLTSKHKMQLYSFYTMFIILIGSLLLMTFIWPCSNAVIKSSLISILIALPIFILSGAINKIYIFKSLKDSIESAWGLSKLLILIWLLSNICKNLLNMDISIATFANLTIIPDAFLPLIVYLFSGMFAFLTGSSYGTFGLFIPIAVQITQNVNSEIQIITVAASLSGSLLACFSMTSDTLKLTTENTNGNIGYIRFAQLPYGIMMYLVSALCFLLFGIFVPYGQIYSVVITLTLLSGFCTCYLILIPSINNYFNKIKFISLINSNIKIINNIQITYLPYPKNEYTFHSRFAIIEQIIQRWICFLLKVIFKVQFISYPLKMPGL